MGSLLVGLFQQTPRNFQILSNISFLRSPPSNVRRFRLRYLIYFLHTKVSVLHDFLANRISRISGTFAGRSLPWFSSSLASPDCGG